MKIKVTSVTLAPAIPGPIQPSEPTFFVTMEPVLGDDEPFAGGSSFQWHVKDKSGFEVGATYELTITPFD